MSAASVFIEIIGSILLFGLVFGMSATVDVKSLRSQLNNLRAIITGLVLQYAVLPFIGFSVVNLLNFDHTTGVTLLVVTSSPGGSYSNWWCSMFNADLALSVTMTSVSSILSTVFLPLNLAIYARYSYNDDVLETLDWGALIFALLIVISAVCAGLFASAYYRSPEFNRNANVLGNVTGILLVLFSLIISISSEEAKVWNREWQFYAGTATPCLFGLIFANVVTRMLGLIDPDCVTVSIECCYQNVGIATSVALGMFNGDERAQAVAVPLYYGIVEALVLLIYCTTAWKAGWTKAPATISFWQMITTSYEVLQVEQQQPFLQHEGGGVVLSGAAGVTPVRSSDNKTGTATTTATATSRAGGRRGSGEKTGDDADGFYHVEHNEVEDGQAELSANKNGVAA